MDPAHYFFPKHADTKNTCWARVGIDRDLEILADSFPHPTWWRTWGSSSAKPESSFGKLEEPKEHGRWTEALTSF